MSIQVSAKLTNTGAVVGSETAQLYISFPATSELTHPSLILKAFKKERDMQPGETRTVVFDLDKYAVSYWEERFDSWVVESGEYKVHVGPGSEELPLAGSFRIERREGFEWNGL